MSEALRQVVWKCDRCGGDAQAIFGIFPSCKCGSTSFKAAQPPAPTAQQCPCKDRPADQCPGEWEPGCDLGANPAHVQVAQPVQQPGAEAEPIAVEAVAEVRSGDDGLYLDWLIEGGICALVEGCVLVMPSQPITDDEGSGEVYLAAPAQRQPLSDEEIEAIWKAHVLPGFGERQRFYSPVVYARAIESAHGIAAQKGEKL